MGEIMQNYGILIIFIIAGIGTCFINRFCRRRQLILHPINLPNEERDLENVLQQSLVTYNEEVILSLESWGEKDASSFEKYEENMECPICMEEIEKNESLYNIQCQHILHKKCLEEAIKSNYLCPICRNKIQKM